MAENPTRTSHGVFAGQWASLLWRMMQHLGYETRPTYQGYRYELGSQAQWRVEVLLYSNLEPDTMFHIFDAPIRRAAFSEGLQDAARQAVIRLRHMYDHLFQDTGFHYYPMHIPTRVDSTFRSADGEDSPELTHQVDLSKAMDYCYGNALQDLQTVQETLQETEEKLKAAEGELARYKAGEASSSEPDYTPVTP